MKKSKFVLIGLASIIFSSCVSFNYIERDKDKNLKLLKSAPEYSKETSEIQFENRIDQKRTAEIQEYFLQQGIDLDRISKKDKSSWEKSKEIAEFVANNVRHSNPTDYPKVRNSIALWDYSLTHPNGFNCRMHSILLGEMLTAAGIPNRFITCLPYDKNDNDCHVVNIVWLKELNKWAMIDSDMHEYITDENGIPLSLEEMREYLINDKKFNIVPLTNNKIDKDYLTAYWTKNLYYFACHTMYGYSVEENGKRPISDVYMHLIPKDYELEEDQVKVYNNKDFWQAPVFQDGEKK